MTPSSWVLNVVLTPFRSYIALPIFFVLWLGYKLFYRTRVIPLVDVDLVAGKQDVDEEEESAELINASELPTWRKIWDAL